MVRKTVKGALLKLHCLNFLQSQVSQVCTHGPYLPCRRQSIQVIDAEGTQVLVDGNLKLLTFCQVALQIAH